MGNRRDRTTGEGRTRRPATAVIARERCSCARWKSRCHGTRPALTRVHERLRRSYALTRTSFIDIDDQPSQDPSGQKRPLATACRGALGAGQTDQRPLNFAPWSTRGHRQVTPTRMLQQNAPLRDGDRGRLRATCGQIIVQREQVVGHDGPWMQSVEHAAIASGRDFEEQRFARTTGCPDERPDDHAAPGG